MEIDQAIILAGGAGTRLRPLTLTVPKALIPIHDRTLTEHALDIFQKFGVKNITLSVGYMASKVMDYFGNGQKFGFNISYAIEDKPMGTGSFLKLMPKLKNAAIVINGDNLFNIDFEKMYELHKKTSAYATIALKSVEDPTKFGVARIEGDLIYDFVEKPSMYDAPSNLVSSGYYIFSPEVFDAAPDKTPLSLENDVFPMLAKMGKLAGYKDDGQWFDTGTWENYERVIKEWKGIH